MTDAEKRDIVEGAVDNLSECELLGIWNDYCDYNNYCDDRVYYVDELDELCYSMKPTEIISRYGELDGFEYFKDGVYVEGSNSLLDLIDYGALIDYIIDNEEDFDNSDIADALEEIEEEDDDEWEDEEEDEE
jgi:hypothetical protein